MFRVSVDHYVLITERGPLPDMYAHYRSHARLAEEFDVKSPDGQACFVGVGQPLAWPDLVVAQRFSPHSAGFDPGAILVPETATLFIGAGSRLLAYRLAPSPVRLWEDLAHFGFYTWCRHGGAVLMSAELELAAWDLEGRKLWTTFVEPPWDYRVEAGQVILNVMGLETRFDALRGPAR